MSEWSTRDGRGITTHTLYLRPRRQVSGERHRSADHQADVHRIVLTGPHRRLLREILRRFKGPWRWERVLALAGSTRVELAHELLSTLLEAGYIKLIERRDVRGWHPVRAEPLARRELCVLAGLIDRDDLMEATQRALAYQPRFAVVNELQSQLGTNRLDIQLRRANLIPHLDRWLEAGTTGTRREFALFATGDTKGVHDADWDWLDARGVLDAAGIVEHVPLLLVGGAFSMRDGNGYSLDVAMACGPLGVPMTAILRAVTVKAPTRWVVLENRTVFDNACKLRPNAGLLYVPGYAPTWWLEAVEALLNRLPAPAVFACDPDPAGIDIALRLRQLWDERSLSWRVAGMDAGALDALPARARKALSPWDRSTLARMENLPVPLEDLREALIRRNIKGEQEGYFTTSRLAALLDNTVR